MWVDLTRCRVCCRVLAITTLNLLVFSRKKKYFFNDGFYPKRTVIRLVNSRRLRQAEHVARMRQKIKSYRACWGTRERTNKT